MSTYRGSKNATATLSGTSMASPHTAGLMAYFLSIHGTPAFNPQTDDNFLPASLQTQRIFVSSSIYSIAHSALPSWVSGFLPPPRLMDTLVAPVPKSPITPAQLKKALLDLASRGILSDLPAQTINLLIFNNATHY